MPNPPTSIHSLPIETLCHILRFLPPTVFLGVASTISRQFRLASLEAVPGCRPGQPITVECTLNVADWADGGFNIDIPRQFVEVVDRQSGTKMWASLRASMFLSMYSIRQGDFDSLEAVVLRFIATPPKFADQTELARCLTQLGQLGLARRPDSIKPVISTFSVNVRRRHSSDLLVMRKLVTLAVAHPFVSSLQTSYPDNVGLMMESLAGSMPHCYVREFCVDDWTETSKESGENLTAVLTKLPGVTHLEGLDILDFAAGECVRQNVSLERRCEVVSVRSGLRNPAREFVSGFLEVPFTFPNVETMGTVWLREGALVDHYLPTDGFVGGRPFPTLHKLQELTLGIYIPDVDSPTYAGMADGTTTLGCTIVSAAPNLRTLRLEIRHHKSHDRVEQAILLKGIIKAILQVAPTTCSVRSVLSDLSKFNGRGTTHPLAWLIGAHNVGAGEIDARPTDFGHLSTDYRKVDDRAP
ncbi:hypothetical protein HDU93_002396 [Gonapodya sp. JEL0774]|nr:hypothetical protein HDU93_002396 [Gonapodya sp. JEL0774]